jgi:hypothetical protein
MLSTVASGQPHPTDDFAVKIVAQAGGVLRESRLPGRLQISWALCSRVTIGQRSLSTKTQTRQIEFELPHIMRVLFLRTHNGVSRALRNALLALTLVIVLGYGMYVTMSVVLGRLPSLAEMIGVALLLGLLVVVAVRWLHKRRMRRAVVDLQDSALW